MMLYNTLQRHIPLMLTLCFLAIFDCATAQAPLISSFSPVIAKTGDTITLTGSNFNTNPANNIVYFGAAKGTVITSSSTSLNVKVPAGATFDFITELNTGTQLQCSTPYPFQLKFEPSTHYLSDEDFEPMVQIPYSVIGSGYSGIGNTRLSDLDGDGKSDIITTDNSDYNTGAFLRIFKNQSTPGSINTGSFTNVLNLQTMDADQIVITTGILDDILVSDINNDGKPDIILSGLLSTSQFDRSVFINTSTTSAISFDTVTGYYQYAGNNYQLSSIADLDGDGKPDFLGQFPQLLQNTSDAGTFSLVSATVNYPSELSAYTGVCPLYTSRTTQIMDLNQDGKPDIISMGTDDNGNTGVYVMNNSSTPGNFSFNSYTFSIVSDSLPASNYTLRLGDIDGDGLPDIIGTHSGDNTHVFLLKNTTANNVISFAPPVFLPDYNPQMPISAFYLALSDLDGDGKLDIVLDADAWSGGLVLYHNIATPGSLSAASFEPPHIIPCMYPRHIDIGDIDNDGLPDIAAARMDAYQGEHSSLMLLRNRPLPVVDPIPLTSCGGDTVAIHVTIAGSEGAQIYYHWQIYHPNSGYYGTITDNDTYSGTNTATLTIQNISPDMDAAVYRCSVMSNNFNNYSHTDTLHVSSIISPVIENNNPVLSIDSTYNQYQWYHNENAITNADSQQLTISDTGSYYVIVSNSTRCSAVSDTVFIDSVNNPTGISNYGNPSSISIYPNPVKNALYISKQGKEALQYHLYNVTGKLLLSGAISDPISTINTGQFRPGIYFIEINSLQTNHWFRFIKQ